MALRLRALTQEEQATIERLAPSRIAPVRQVERAKILLAASQGQKAPAIAAQMGLDARPVRTGIQRFNAQGLPGLADPPRPGKPPVYTAAERSEVMATALTSPQALEQPFGCWTRDRLQVYLNEEKGIAIKRSRIDERLIAEGLRGRQQETWFSEKATLEPKETKAERPLDPAFAEKRGHRDALHDPSRRQRGSRPGSDGAGGRQELSG